MSGNTYAALMILVMAAVTVFLRFLPFLLFPEGKQAPKLVGYLSRVLPCAVMGMLVVYCFKGVCLTAWPFALPEAISAAIVVALYIWKRNTLLSILAGTVCYMLLVQLVF